MQNAKKLVISISTIILAAFVAIAFLIYDASESVAIIGIKGSYAEAFAKDNNVKFYNIYDSENPDVEIPIPDKEESEEEPKDTNETDKSNSQKENSEFSYNYEDETVNITVYKGDSKYVVIPKTIDGLPVKTVSMNVLRRGIAAVLIPENVTSIKTDFHSARYTSNFYVTIAMMTAGYAFSLFATIIGLKKNKSAEDTFYGIPFIYSGMATLIVITVWSTVSIILGLSAAFEILVLILILSVALGKLFKKSVAREIVVEKEEQFKVQISFIKTLTADADVLIRKAKSDEIKTETKKIYEAIRYSDPISNEELEDIETQITIKFNEFSQAVESDLVDESKSKSAELLTLINDRNKKCKLLK